MQKVWDFIFASLPFIHSIAAVFWVGSLLFLAIVMTPLIDKIRPPSFQRMVARRAWQMAHKAMWIAAGLVFVTGAMILQGRGQLSARLVSAGSLLTPMGQKLAIFAMMVGASLIHDLWLGYGARLRDPEASTDPPAGIGAVIPWILAIAGLAAFLLSRPLVTP
jgi:putative copper export protein